MGSKHLPPAEHRFRPGVSPNPKGRPKGSKNKKPKMRTPALDETVKYPVAGVLRRMSRREAIVLYAQSRALHLQDPKLTSLLLEADRKLAEAEAKVDYNAVVYFLLRGWGGGGDDFNGMVRNLGLGRLMYRAHRAQRVQLKPDVVTLALSRLDDHRLTRDEQKLVVAFTLTPWKVAWPDWWEKDLRKLKCRLPKRFLIEDEAEWKRAFGPNLRP